MPKSNIKTDIVAYSKSNKVSNLNRVMRHGMSMILNNNNEIVDIKEDDVVKNYLK